MSACIVGGAIIAVPTGIVTADLVRSPAPPEVSTQACPSCGAQGHRPGARHGIHCGASRGPCTARPLPPLEGTRRWTDPSPRRPGPRRRPGGDGYNPRVDDAEAPWALLLERVRAGDPGAASRLFEAVYEDLHRRARSAFRAQRPGHTLTPTALVHEAWLKVARPGVAAGVQDRMHFLNVASRAMRHVLVNHARDRAAAKRGGGRPREHVTLSGLAQEEAPEVMDAEALSAALEALESLDARQAQVADLRLLGGLTVEEVAGLLGVSRRTVEADWRMAKDFLARRLAPPAAAG